MYALAACLKLSMQCGRGWWEGLGQPHFSLHSNQLLPLISLSCKPLPQVKEMCMHGGYNSSLDGGCLRHVLLLGRKLTSALTWISVCMHMSVHLYHSLILRISLVPAAHPSVTQLLLFSGPMFETSLNAEGKKNSCMREAMHA